MRIFIAHSSSDLEAKVASRIEKRLRKVGHNATAGNPIEVRTGRLSRRLWARYSFSDPVVREYLERSDILIAVCLDDAWLSKNVSSEIAYFLARSIQDSLIIIKGESIVIPLYLKSPYIIEFKKDYETMFSSLEAFIDTISRNSSKKRGQIFLSYSREDEQIAKEICSHLIKDGFQVWFDQINLSAGQDWELEITKAIRQSVAFVTLLSSNSVNRRGYFQKELRRSLEVAEEIPEGEIYIIPLKLDDCEVPESLKKYQWSQYQHSNNYDQLRFVLEKVFSDILREVR